MAMYIAGITATGVTIYYGPAVYKYLKARYALYSYINKKQLEPFTKGGPALTFYEPSENLSFEEARKQYKAIKKRGVKTIRFISNDGKLVAIGVKDLPHNMKGKQDWKSKDKDLEILYSVVCGGRIKTHSFEEVIHPGKHDGHYDERENQSKVK